jgi:hypothetical protein
VTVTFTLCCDRYVTVFAMSVLTILSRSSVRRAFSPFLTRGYAAKDSITERKPGVSAKDTSAAEGECAQSLKPLVLHADYYPRTDAFVVSSRYSPGWIELPERATCSDSST